MRQRGLAWRVFGLCQREGRAQLPSTVDGGGVPESAPLLAGGMAGALTGAGATTAGAGVGAGAGSGATTGADAAVALPGADLAVPGLLRPP